MKRLREMEAEGAELERARSLLEAAAPLPESEARMARVRAALDRPRARGLGRLPALALAAFVALFGASAFAAVRYVVEQARTPAPSAAPVAPRAPAAPTRPSPAPAPEPVAPAAFEEVEARPAPKRAKTPQRRKPPVEEAEAQQAEALAADSALVHRAVQALRREHKPAVAARLLAEHRRRVPNGPLAEEVLSLQVEAALALSDPRARGYAREYLARYPGGRYSAIARRALALEAQQPR